MTTQIVIGLKYIFSLNTQNKLSDFDSWPLILHTLLVGLHTHPFLMERLKSLPQ